MLLCLDGLSLLIIYVNHPVHGACVRLALIIDWSPSPFLSVHPRHREIGKAMSTRLSTDSFLQYAYVRLRVRTKLEKRLGRALRRLYSQSTTLNSKVIRST